MHVYACICMLCYIVLYYVNTSQDRALRRKLRRWSGGAADAAKLPFAARLRGLSGSSLGRDTCRDRLSRYERYWHQREGQEI